MKIKNARFVDAERGIIDMTIINDDGTIAGFSIGEEIPFTYDPRDPHGLAPMVRKMIGKIKVRKADA